MANFVSILTTEEAKRLSEEDMQMLYNIQRKANGEIASDAERKAALKEVIEKKTNALNGDSGYAEELEKTFC